MYSSILVKLTKLLWKIGYPQQIVGHLYSTITRVVVISVYSNFVCFVAQSGEPFASSVLTVTSSTNSEVVFFKMLCPVLCHGNFC